MYKDYFYKRKTFIDTLTDYCFLLPNSVFKNFRGHKEQGHRPAGNQNSN